MKIFLETGISPNQKFKEAEVVEVLPNGNYVVDVDGTLSTITTGFFNIGPVVYNTNNRELIKSIEFSQQKIIYYMDDIKRLQDQIRRINLKEFKNAENS